MNTLKLGSSAANKMERILTGERMKYTVRVHLPDGNVLEFQRNAKPIVTYNDAARSLWLTDTDYPHASIMPWPEGAIMLCEENKNGTA